MGGDPCNAFVNELKNFCFFSMRGEDRLTGLLGEITLHFLKVQSAFWSQHAYSRHCFSKKLRPFSIAVYYNGNGVPGMHTGRGASTGKRLNWAVKEPCPVLIEARGKLVLLICYMSVVLDCILMNTILL